MSSHIQISGQSHVPVLLQEVMYWLRPGPGKQYIDCTLGMSGMAQEVLKQSAPDGKFLGIDRDPQAVAMGHQSLAPYGDRVELRHGNFHSLLSIAAEAGVSRVDGIVFDLGVSSPQLTQADRGFSFTNDGPLDMRMDQTRGRTVAEYLERVSEKELAEALFTYGEERYARRIARAIVQERGQPILSTGRLSDIIRRAVPAPYRRGRLHCATRTFQALRIIINEELDGLADVFRDAVSLLRPSGRLCVIAFHSLEDRIVKQTFRELSANPNAVLMRLTKKPLTPSYDEQRQNPRSRSAKLRVAERLAEATA